MSLTPKEELALARQGRNAGLVVAVAALAHLAAPWLLSAAGIDQRYANLISLFAIAAFIWSFAVAWRIWRRRREE